MKHEESLWKKLKDANELINEYKSKWNESKKQLKEVVQECSLMKDLIKRFKDELKQVTEQLNLKPDQS